MDNKYYATEQTIENYVCSLIDILGQKEELLKLNSLSLEKDTKQIENIFQNTYSSKIAYFRDFLDRSVNLINDYKVIKTENFSSNNIRSYSFSDLIVSYVSLRDDVNKLQFEGMYYLLVANGITFLEMLSKSIPLRGGIDIGIGISIANNEIYGSVILNPYLLESTVASSIRLVVGEKLYEYIASTANNQIEANESIDSNINWAKKCLAIIKKDTDGSYILDYLSEPFRTLCGSESFEKSCRESYTFLTTQCSKYKKEYNFSVAKKYDSAIKYFKDNGIITV